MAAPKLENVADVYPLTPTQQGMLYHAVQAPQAEVYIEQARGNLDEPLDAGLLQRAWQELLERHTILRTAFLWQGLDTPLQVVRRKVELPWRVLDWRERPPDETAAALDELARQERAAGFDLAQAPLLRLLLVQLPGNQDHLIWTFHHIILDGWSAQQIQQEALRRYAALARGESPAQPAATPFRDYVAWLQQQDQDAAESYWRERLAGFGAATPLAIDRPARGREPLYARADLSLSTAESADLRAFARAERVTLNTVLQGAWGLLLSRYSGENDVIFGATVSGRPSELPGIERAVGLFINTLPVRVSAEPGQALRPWLQALQEQQLQTNRFEYSPLAKVQGWRDDRRPGPLFDSILVFENYPPPQKDPDIPVLRDRQFYELSNYPLALLVLPRGEQILLRAIYDGRRFSAAAIERLLGHVRSLLSGMAANPAGTLGQLSLLTADELEEWQRWNDTAAPLPDARPLPQQITQHAQDAPDSLAVVATDGRLSYEDLNRRANQLAHLLLEAGLAQGAPVALFVERSAAMLVGILGIQKAGGAYVPLDPAYPAQRTALILEEVGASLVVAQSHTAPLLPAGPPPILLGPGGVPLEAADEAEPEVQLGPDDPAYIIYTSGSTGKPKGVLVTHANLSASTAARQLYYRRPVQRYLLLSSFAFDSSVAGIFWTLADGGALVLPAVDEEKELHAVAGLITAEGVTHTLTLPSLYLLLLDYAAPGALQSLNVVVVAGEACPPGLAEAHFARLPQTALYNEYGPTEATVWCSVQQLQPEDAPGAAPIGRPIPNATLYVLDGAGQLMPLDVPGELVVGGAGVSPGYWRDEALTAERFRPLIVAGGTELGRVYHTGDRAKRDEDGRLHFLGRSDDQVKIRGRRIEPGEIEGVLQQFPGLGMVAVLAVDDAPPAPDEELLRALAGLDPAEAAALLDEAAAQ